MAQQATEKQKMSKPMKIALIVMGSLLAAVIVCFAILAFIPVKGLAREEINDYLYVDVYNFENARFSSVDNETLADEADAYHAGLLADGLGRTEYTAFRAAFEQVYDGSLRFQTEEATETVQEYDEDGYPVKDSEGLFVTETVTATERVKVVASGIAQQTAGTAERFALEFIYTDGDAVTENKKITVEGEEIEFDRMRVVIYDSKNTITEFVLYFYDNDDLAAEITPVLVTANTTTLYQNLCEIVGVKYTA